MFCVSPKWGGGAGSPGLGVRGQGVVVQCWMPVDGLAALFYIQVHCC
jgi:hypothetical protein